MYTKSDLLAAVAKYENEDGTVFAPLLNTLMFWRGDTGRGVFRAAFKDSPQYLAAKGFMETHEFKSLGKWDTLSFELFYQYICTQERSHRFPETYIDGSNGFAQLVIKPWFDTLLPFRQKQMLEGLNETYSTTYKSLTYHVSQLKDGAHQSLQGAASAVANPPQTIVNLVTALVHPIDTLAHVGKEMYYEPAKTIGSIIPGLLLHNAPTLLHVASTNATVATTVNNVAPQFPAVVAHAHEATQVAHAVEVAGHVSHVFKEHSEKEAATSHDTQYGF